MAGHSAVCLAENWVGYWAGTWAVKLADSMAVKMVAS